MKNTFCKRAVCALCAAVCAFMLLTGCGGGNLDKYYENISELRDCLFAAENADYKVSAISGKREEPYAIDGASGNKRDFTVITVTPASFESNLTYRYRAEINGETYEGDLLPHPFAQTLSADIPVAAKSDFTVTVSAKTEQSLEMKNAVTGELISAEKALTIALERMKNDIKRFKNKGGLNCEIYVRLMENPIDGSGGYFWYVAFIGAEKDAVAVLLKGDTGAVSAVRV